MSRECERKRYTILVHGGTVGAADRVSNERRELIRSIVETAREDLAAGRAALDVVVDAIAAMEDSGILNAGKGSISTTAGFVETDASLMEGHTGRVGAVAAMQRLKNPIVAARIVMDETPHVFLAGLTGQETLIGLGAEQVEPASYFPRYSDAGEVGVDSETVGAVALDRCGNLAAGTSTGGYAGQLPGRVGDSSIIGASTFANERYALSATGRGENFIRRSVTVDIAKRAEYLGQTLKEAADHVVHEILGARDGADGGVIAIGRDGDVVLSAVNVSGELHGYATESTDVTVGVEVS